MESSSCLICELPFDSDHEDIVHVKKRGCKNLKRSSERRRDGKFTYLDLEVDNVSIMVHKKCWRNYIDEKSVVAAENRIRKSLNLLAKKDVLIKIEGENEGEPVLYDALLHVERDKSEKEEFDYANLCLFCGDDASETFLFQQLKKPEYDRKKVKLVSKNVFGNIMLLAAVRGEEVLERVKDKDLISVNARYHVPCYTEYLPALPNNEVLTNFKKTTSLKNYQQNLRKQLLGMDSEKIETSKDEQKEEFDYETHCIICAKDASEDFISRMKKIPEKKRILVSFIKKPETANKLLQLSYKSNETIREEVRSRVKDQDLVALKARYHRHCYIQFYHIKTGSPRGRQRDVNKQLKIVVEDAQPTCWNEFYQDYIINEDVKFNFQIQCIICGREVSGSKPEDSENSIRIIQRHDTGENLLHASFRFTDKWREQVRDRVKDKDLVSLGARYHKSCFPQFFLPPPKTNKQIVCVADGNVSDYLLIDQEEHDVFSDVLDDISLDNDHELLYYDVPIEENDQPSKLRTGEEGENTAFDYQNNCFLCGEDASENFIKQQNKLHREKRITVNVIKKQSIVEKMLDVVVNCDDPWSLKIRERVTNVNSKCIDLRYHKSCFILFINSIKKDAVLNEHSLLRDCGFNFDYEIKTVNTEDGASNDFNCHEIAYQKNTTHGEKSSQESVGDCDDTYEDREENENDRNLTENEDDRNLTENEATITDNLQIDEEYYENKLYENNKNITEILKTKDRKEVSWCSQVCNTCLSPGTKLYRLVRYMQIFNNITGNNNTTEIYVCGECLDDLRKIQVFKEKAIKAKKILDEVRLFSGTKRTDNATTFTDQKCTYNEIQNENCNEDDNIEWDSDNQVNEVETELGSNSSSANSGGKQKSAMTSNVIATKRNNAINLIREDETPDSDLEPATKKQKICEEDPDYVPSGSECENKIIPPKKKKNKEHKSAQCKIIYKETNIRAVVKKVKIDPKDAELWIEKERNSVFFRDLHNKCVLCVSKLHPSESLNRHLTNFHNNTSSTHVCSVCKIVFKTTENLKEHLEQHLFLLRCDLCGYLCYGKHNMKDHVLRHKRSIECLECGTIFGYATEFYAHYKDHFKCNECGKNMLSKEKLRIHVERHHATHHCNECDKTYSDYNKLQKHKKLKHTIERNEESYCVSCDIQFDNTRQFQRHLSRSVAHAHERSQTSQTVTCPECSRVLSSKYRLKQHYRNIHSQEKRSTFPCSKCGKQFASRTHMLVHIKYVHDRVDIPRNKVCQYCSRGFKTNRELIHHIRTHTGEKPHHCPFCDAAFVQRIAMQKHIKKRHPNQRSSILTEPEGTA